MEHFKISPLYMVSNLWRHRELIMVLTKREISARYRGSVMGLAWSFLNPLLMLVIYTVVFNEILQLRWAGKDDSQVAFALLVFLGLITFNLVTEIINRAPGLILSNVNYVKKVVFPIEILSVVSLGSALFNTIISIAIFLIAFVLFNGFVNWTILLLPIILLPGAMMSLGLSWFVSSTAVFIRDISQTASIITTMLMFLSPIFYSLASIPEKLKPWAQLNPLAAYIEQVREILFWGVCPDWTIFTGSLLTGFIIMFFGFIWFQKTRKGFADVF